MKKVKCVFVFCEGPHDVAFVSKVLKVINEYKDFRDKPISELPIPLKDYYETKHKKNEPIIDNEDVVAPFMPRSVLLDKDEKYFIFLYPCAGIDNILKWDEKETDSINAKSKKNFVKKEIESIRKNFKLHLDKLKLSEADNLSNTFIEEPKICFFIDADDMGATSRLTKFKENYRNNFQIDLQLDNFNTWDRDKKIGFFVFYKDESNYTGSLEDLIIDVLSNEVAYADFYQTYNEKISSPDEQARITKVKKSSLTGSGQYKYSGSSLSVIVKDEKKNKHGIHEHNGFLDISKIKANPQCQALADFFNQVVLP